MFDLPDYDLIDETLELHEEKDEIQDEIQDDDDSEYFLERREISEETSVQRDLWDDLNQINPDDLPFNNDFDEV